MLQVFRRLSLILIGITIVLSMSGNSSAQAITGLVSDAKTQEPIMGAAVFVKEFNTGAATDENGRFSIPEVNGSKCTLVISCITYKTIEMECNINNIPLNIKMESDEFLLGEVEVKAKMATNTEMSIVSLQKTLPQVTSGISAAQISKSPDRVASDVVKRIAGVTVIDDRFIIVRGLSQRYNNAWINGLAVPNTEIDSRAFPLDLLPSSQIDNMLIYKSPSPEIPADFSGGFLKITSKGVPEKNSIEVGYTTGFNVRTQFNKFRYNGAGSHTDFLGFGAGKRSLSKDFPAYLNHDKTTPEQVSALTKNGFNNDLSIDSRVPLPDQRLSFVLARRIERENHKVIGNITAISYSNSFKTLENIKNSRYGIYSAQNDAPVYFDDYTDNQYSNDVRLGLMHNWAFIVSPLDRIEFKNLLNVASRNRLTERSGIKDMSSMYYREQTEMQYTTRTTYSGQLSGNHDLSTTQNLTWDAGYSYAKRYEPDRRIITNQAGIGSANDITSVLMLNDDISRYFQNLEDHGASAAVNYKHAFRIKNLKPSLKTGLYGEYRMRDFQNREFRYSNKNLSYEERQTYLALPFEQMLEEQYLGADKVYIEETTRKTNNYSATVGHIAGYAAVEFPIKKFSIYAGARFESHNTSLTRDRSNTPNLTLINKKNINDLNVLPSVNMTYKFSEKHQARCAYGLSVNRPELREISPAVYFDFDLFSEIGGNENLKTAIINNVDLRYEFYPNHGEIISMSLFYKHFKNPIEWTFIDMGGSLRYLYENANKADSYGIEIEARKSLDFMRMPAFTVVLNVAFIKSNVQFNTGDVLIEPDRPMQGQSPYIINAGLYYHSKKGAWDIALLYNRIGKRIVGLGKSNSPDQNINNMIPDSYEMPRNVLDFTVNKSLGKYIDIRLSIKDILSEDIVFKQFPKFEKDGSTFDRQQETRRYNSGQMVALGITVKMN